VGLCPGVRTARCAAAVVHDPGARVKGLGRVTCGRRRGYHPGVRTILLLLVSNVFMTFAWYGHLRFRDRPLLLVIVVSWLIAFAEYCFQVPANRLGYGQFSAAQLKTIQEVITLVVFCVFSVLYLREPLKWNYVVGFALIAGAVFFVFKKW
jgi:uncharacterized protein